MPFLVMELDAWAIDDQWKPSECAFTASPAVRGCAESWCEQGWSIHFGVK